MHLSKSRTVTQWLVAVAQTPGLCSTVTPSTPPSLQIQETTCHPASKQCLVRCSPPELPVTSANRKLPGAAQSPPCSLAMAGTSVASDLGRRRGRNFRSEEPERPQRSRTDEVALIVGQCSVQYTYWWAVLAPPLLAQTPNLSCLQMI